MTYEVCSPPHTTPVSVGAPAKAQTEAKASFALEFCGVVLCGKQGDSDRGVLREQQWAKWRTNTSTIQRLKLKQ